METKKLLYFLYGFFIFVATCFFLSKSSFAYFENLFEDDIFSRDSAPEDSFLLSDSVYSDSETALNGTVYLEGEFLDGDILKISVLAENISVPTLGIAFHLVYPKDTLAFLRYNPGDFLEQGGDPFYLVKNLLENGNIVFGETLRQDDSFPVGEGRIADFYFQIIEGKDFLLKFDRGVISSIETVRQDLNNIEWKDLNLSKKGVFGSFDFLDGEASLFSQHSVFNFKNISLGILSFFGLFILIFKLIKFLKRHRAYQKIRMNS